VIDVKTAVRKASAFLQEVLQEDRIEDIRLEEVELIEVPSGPPIWSVTLSFLRGRLGKKGRPAPWFQALPGTDREAKVVRIKSDGSVIGMKQWVTL
jgi:hypothetical protein